MLDGKVQELILATNPNIEGETTALYLSRLVKPAGLKVTRIARGLPVGGDLEYADEITLLKALEGRREYNFSTEQREGMGWHGDERRILKRARFVCFEAYGKKSNTGSCYDRC
jgi:hypothetical protein